MAISTDADDLARELWLMKDKVDRFSALAGSLGNLIDVTGSLVPNLFSHHSPQSFTILPIPSVGLVGSNNQFIENNAYTTLTYEAASSLSSGLKFYSYSEGGIDANTTAGTITMIGEPENSLFLITGFVQWEANSSGFREVRIRDAAGDFTPVAIHAGFAGSGVVQSFATVRQMYSSIATVSLNAYQNMGTSLAVTRRCFQATRIR